MTDTQSTNDESAETPETPPEGGTEESSTTDENTSQEDAQEPTEGTDAPDEDDSKGDGDHDELPEWAKKQLTKARKDAAGYRERLAAANESLSKATSTEEFEQVQQDLKAVTLELETERIANRHGIPDELRAVLRGDSAEEIEAHAELLSKHVSNTHADPTDLSGGLNPRTSEPVKEDPRSLARKHSRRNL